MARHDQLWQERREERGLPPPKKIRERGKCFSCGEPAASPAGISHCRLFEDRGKGFAIDLCCACVDCKGKHG